MLVTAITDARCLAGTTSVMIGKLVAVPPQLAKKPTALTLSVYQSRWDPIVAGKIGPYMVHTRPEPS